MSYECPQCMYTFDETPDNIVTMQSELAALRKQNAEIVAALRNLFYACEPVCEGLPEQVLKDTVNALNGSATDILATNDAEIRRKAFGECAEIVCCKRCAEAIRREGERQ